MNSYSSIISVATYLPENLVDNSKLCEQVDSSDEWIYERTGIKQRYVASEQESPAFMAEKVALKLMNHHQLDSNKIGLIIVATCSSGLSMPGCSSYVQKKIQANNAVVFDLNVACSGIVYALHLADLMMKTHGYQYAPSVGQGGAPMMSAGINQKLAQ